MSLASIAYREVEKLVSTWTEKYQYHLSLLDTKPEQVKFMVQFSLVTPKKPVPNATVRVYFTVKNLIDDLQITFRFEKDSLIHTVDQTIRHKQLEKWLDDVLAKKLLVRKTLFYMGTSYQKTRISDQRQDLLLHKQNIQEQIEQCYIAPELLSDQQHYIEVMESGSCVTKNFSDSLKAFWKEVDPENIKVITHAELKNLLQKMGVRLKTEDFKELLSKVDPQDTGIVEYNSFQGLGNEIIDSIEVKKLAESHLKQKQQQEMFGSILALVTDETQDIEQKILEKFISKDEDETGLTNIQEVKSTLEWINSTVKEENKEELFSPIELAQITKILTDAYGYKEIPYNKIHHHIINLKLSNFSKGRIGAQLNNLEVYLRDAFDAQDEKKFGKISLEALLKALRKCEKIKLTKPQLYVLENILPKDNKGEVNYLEQSKFLAELIKKLYLNSLNKKQKH